METNIKQLKCGGCGEENHRIYQRENGELITECVNCKSQTEIVIRKPEIITRHNPGSSGSGSLCVFKD